MIAKASENGKRGSDTQGLLRYLFGKGKANEHTNPHLVAAWDPEWLEGGAFAQLIGQRRWLPREHLPRLATMAVLVPGR